MWKHIVFVVPFNEMAFIFVYNQFHFCVSKTENESWAVGFKPKPCDVVKMSRRPFLTRFVFFGCSGQRHSRLRGGKKGSRCCGKTKL